MGRLVIGLLVGLAVRRGADRMGEGDAVDRRVARPGRGAPAPGAPGAEAPDPLVLPERIASGGATDVERNLAGTARYAIEYNRPLWSGRAAAALEAAGFPDEAAKVRAGLASAWIRD